MPDAKCCDFMVATTATKTTQGGSLGIDGSPAQLEAGSVTEILAFRCRYCLRLVKVKDIPDDGRTYFCKRE